MSDDVYKITEVVGSSSVSQEDAIRNAVRRTARTVENLGWFEVVENRGFIDQGEVAYWQVKVKIGFTLVDRPHVGDCVTPSMKASTASWAPGTRPVGISERAMQTQSERRSDGP